MNRKERDHERYMQQREERLQRQRAYYADHREQCRAAVKRSREKRIMKELQEL